MYAHFNADENDYLLVNLLFDYGKDNMEMILTWSK